jgi:hypothetical protein
MNKLKCSLGITGTILFIFSGCVKESNAPAALSASSSSEAVSGGMVLTPFGYMSAQHVHFIAENYEISIINNHVTKVESSTRKVVEDYGEVTRTKSIYGKQQTDLSVVPLPSGWITYASWTNNTTTKPITNFKTSWKVPTAPTTHSGQTLFLFNGMQDGLANTSHILQPVLQWGPSAAGGGLYWSVTNWYVSGVEAFYGTLIKVKAGQNLQGVMKSTGRNGNLFDYTSFFTGFANSSSLKVSNAAQLFWAAETLETYHCQKLTDYPPDAKIDMDSIQILKQKTNASIHWGTTTVSANQHTQVVSNASPGGEVDIYFH